MLTIYTTGYLTRVQQFLNGSPSPGATPHLYCDDTWLTRLSRTDAAWDAEKDTIMTIDPSDPNGAFAPVAIEDIAEYRQFLWKDGEDGSDALVRNANIPYWSDDLGQYIFDQDYARGKTYCTVSKDNLRATQEQTIRSTVTLCPYSFTTRNFVDGLGSKKPTKGMALGKVLPRSATFYHEMFHLVMGTADTPDITCKSEVSHVNYSQASLMAVADEWPVQQKWLNNPMEIQECEDESNGQFIQRNPESYVFFSVGYWYFQQTQWSKQSNQRWSFQSGVAELVQI